MSFIQLILNTTSDTLNVAHIQSLVDRKVEENLNLDYKSIRALEDPDELSRDVSAFANSEGGLIILGVEEGRRDSHGIGKIFPSRIEWGPETYTKEALKQRLGARIHPSIRNLRIYPLRKDRQVIFVIEVPQSENTPHMAADRRYYFRNNFTRSIMEHYQVADLFGRRRHPELELECQLQYAGSFPGEDRRIDLASKIINVGSSVAKNWLVVVTAEGARHGGIVTVGGPWAEESCSERKHKFVLKQWQEVVYPELPIELPRIELRLEAGGRIKLDFVLATEDMQIIRSNWAADYDDFNELGWTITRRVCREEGAT